MEKEKEGIGNLKIVVGTKIQITPEELEIMAKQFRLAAEERCNPGQVMHAEYKGIIWEFNPHISRGDLERKLSLKIQKQSEDVIALPVYGNNSASELAADFQ